MPKQITTKQINGFITETKEIERDGIKIGIIEGYIATWDLDRGDYYYRDQFVKGCFAESILEFKTEKRMPRLKDGHYKTIGGWQHESLKEDNRGLFGVAEINLDVQQGREVYAMAKQKVLTDFSIGFECQEKTVDDVNRIRTITKAKIWEGSIVDEPMNPNANVTAVKTAVKDLPEAINDLFAFTAKALGVLGSEPEALTDELKENVNERFIKESRVGIIDGDTLIVDKVTLKELTPRMLECIIASKKAVLTEAAIKTLISYLNFRGMRDAVTEKERDALEDSGIKETLEKLNKQLMEK